MQNTYHRSNRAGVLLGLLLLAIVLAWSRGIGSGWLDGLEESRYPRSDCGFNNFFALLLTPQDFCVKKSFPQECVKRWVNTYTRRAAEQETFEEKMRILKLLDQGIEYHGYTGLYDQVLHDLAMGVIVCTNE